MRCAVSDNFFPQFNKFHPQIYIIQPIYYLRTFTIKYPAQSPTLSVASTIFIIFVIITTVIVLPKPITFSSTDYFHHYQIGTKPTSIICRVQSPLCDNQRSEHNFLHTFLTIFTILKG